MREMMVRVTQSLLTIAGLLGALALAGLIQ